MNGSRIVNPKSLQQEYLQCLHVGHLGISKCRARAKTTVFWPNIDWDVSQLIICVDHISFFIWERPLPDMQSDTVIFGLKMIFSENGSPEIPITDNGWSFISEDFNQFAMEWSFVHKMSSPCYPKGNAHAE